MPTFTLRGDTYDYAPTSLPGGVEVHSWEYGHWPRVEAQVPLVAGGTVAVYAVAIRWAGDIILVRWPDDDDHYHHAWIPKQAVRKLTPSEADIIDYHECPPELRAVRWGKRLPGFLPE